MSGHSEGRPVRRKSLGQSFLEDRNILALEAKLANPKNKIVLEIGAGDGRLTEALLTQKPKKIIAVEKDPRYASILRERFAGRTGTDGCVEVIEADFLELEFPGDVEIIVGNIPYYISSDIIFKIAKQKFEGAILMVQKEFAEKMVAKPGEKNYGRLSVTSQIYFNISLERKVLRHLFRPLPKADSAIIVLTPSTLAPSGSRISLTQHQENIIRWLFQHKNKTVRNALLDSKMFDEKELELLGPYLKRRARTLTKDECLEIARILG